MYEVKVKTHQGKRKKYYTVHLYFDKNNIRIYGKFGSLNKAMQKAREVAQKYGLDKIITD
ncbi:MAG: hypothetical protein QXZ43_04625 [Candidatus Aenigmatarchaeota archaeon]